MRNPWTGYARHTLWRASHHSRRAASPRQASPLVVTKDRGVEMDARRWPVGVAYGTRMEAFRLGPLVRALHVSELLRPVVVVAPREPLGDVNDIFGVSPDADLGG